MKITARDLYSLGLVDDIIPEPLGGAHMDKNQSAEFFQQHLLKHLDELLAMSVEERLKKRYEKFRGFGRFEEKIQPVENGEVPAAPAAVA